jgi:intergrase/recombinase
MGLKYCRKIYASYLRANGIPIEVIDLLQGRVPKPVFVRHYLTPGLSYRDDFIYAISYMRLVNSNA